MKESNIRVPDSVREAVSTGLEKAQTYTQRLKGRFSIPAKWQLPAAIFGSLPLAMGGAFTVTEVAGRGHSIGQTALILGAEYSMMAGAFLFGRVYESLLIKRGRGLYLPMTSQPERDTFQKTEHGVLVPPTTVVSPSPDILIPGKDVYISVELPRTLREVNQYSQRVGQN